jgi:SAM-dependent methyltransferase
MVVYAGSQPSIVRRAIADLPDKQSHCFVDLGCGKGRVVLIAAEYAFPMVVGVDISLPILRIARTNAAIVQTHFPEQRPVWFVCANAYHFLPSGDGLVVYLYHPFGKDGIARLVCELERRIAEQATHVFVVYYNPVWGKLFDASLHFTRWAADRFDYASEELGYGPSTADSVVVWQSMPQRFQTRAGCDRPIRVTYAGLQAEVDRSSRNQ